MTDHEVTNGAPAAEDGTRETAPPSPELVREAIRPVVDPEIGISIVDLGLVYDIQVEDGVAKITYTLTTMGCPVGPLIEHQVKEMLGALPGLRDYELTLTFTPPWSPEKMTEEARAALGMF